MPEKGFLCKRASGLMYLRKHRRVLTAASFWLRPLPYIVFYFDLVCIGVYKIIHDQ